MRFALDSNVMIYADVIGDRRADIALQFLDKADPEDIIIPAQSAAETMQWLVRKARLPKPEAADRLALWLSMYALAPTDLRAFDGATALVRMHDFQVFDAIILAAAEAGRADILLSEDMQDGFRWRGVTIVNPFADEPSPLIAKIMNG